MSNNERWIKPLWYLVKQKWMEVWSLNCYKIRTSQGICRPCYKSEIVLNSVNSQQCIAFSSDQESLLWERKYGLLSLDSMLKWQQQSQDALLWKTTQHHFLSLSQRNKAKNKNRKKRVTCIKHGKLHSTILSMFCLAQGPLQWNKVSVAQKWWFQFQLKQFSECKNKKKKQIKEWPA